MPMISLAAIQCTELVAEFSVASFLHSVKAAMVGNGNDFRIRFLYLRYV